MVIITTGSHRSSSHACSYIVIILIIFLVSFLLISWQLISVEVAQGLLMELPAPFALGWPGLPLWSACRLCPSCLCAPMRGHEGGWACARARAHRRERTAASRVPTWGSCGLCATFRQEGAMGLCATFQWEEAVSFVPCSDQREP